jgi:enoyl-[acyl-carrier-protein] reductase (NADH)
MPRPLENKRALVTGGSRGIGAAVVRRLAREGAHVALTYVSNPDQAHETVRAAQAFGVKSLAVQADSADAKAVVAAVEQTVGELGGIDILINNAGIAVIAPIDDYRLEDLDRTLADFPRNDPNAREHSGMLVEAGGISTNPIGPPCSTITTCFPELFPSKLPCSLR